MRFEPHTRVRRLSVVLLLLATLPLILPVTTHAVHTTGQFELDGNTEDTPTGLPDDWDNVYKSVTGLGTAAPSNALVHTFLPDSAEADLSTFGSSNKDFQPASAWQCNSDNNPQEKTNVLSAYAALYDVGLERVLFFGADRESNLGEANFGFWLFQNPLRCTAPATGAGQFTAQKVHGDLFIVSTFTSGGKLDTVKLYVWTDPDGIPENGDECLGDGVDCTAAHSGEGHPLVSGADCRNVSPDPDTVSPHFCATVNDTATIDAAWRSGIEAREFFEGGVNLSALIGERCHISFMAETRASQEFTADMKDFVIGEFNTCGQITIRKKTVGADGSFTFDVTTGALSPAQFTLSNDGVKTFLPVTTGSFGIAEAPLDGWELSDISCASVGPGTSTTTDLQAGAVSITMGPAGTVDCTFTNTKRPTITVTKVVDSASDPGKFNLHIDGETKGTGANVGTGGTTGPIAVTIGSHTVGETAGTGTNLADYTSTIDCGQGPVAGTSTSVTVSAGQQKTCTITNTRKRSITVNKVLVPADDPGRFNLQIDGGTAGTGANVGNAGSTGPVSQSAGSHNVGETGAAGTSLDDYTSTIDCGSGAITGTSTTVNLTDSIVCTITNTRKTKLTVTKTVVPAGDPGRFNLQIDGSTAGAGANVGNGGSTGAVVVSAGQHTVSETAMPGTDLSNYLVSYGGDCDSTGKVTLTAGQSKTCVITNTRVAVQPTTATLIVIKHVVNLGSGSKTAADFTMTVSGTAVPGGVTSFLGAESPGTSLVLNPGIYNVTETTLSGYVPSLSGDCSNISIAAGQTKTCTITNTNLRPAPYTFCSKSTVTSVLNPSGTRFPKNKGIDHLVRVDLGESVQAAVDAAIDANGDGYIIVGVIAGAGSPGPYGGHTAQRVTVSRSYDKPFALVGCSVTMHDPNRADGLPTAWITASASNPITASNPSSVFVMDLHAADSEVAGWKVDGNKRELRNVNATGNAVGLWVVGDINKIQNGAIDGNWGVGILVQGTGNTLDSGDAMGNVAHGIQVVGNNNVLSKMDSGDVGKGNGGDGVNVSGNANVLSELSAFANGGSGIAVAGNNNQILKSVSGDKGRGNAQHGIQVAGSGNLLQESKTSANRADGFTVSGGVQASPNLLKMNQSNYGSSGSTLENGTAEYRLLHYVTNYGGGNKADNVAIPKTTSPARCPSFPATNATVNAASPIVCE